MARFDKGGVPRRRRENEGASTIRFRKDVLGLFDPADVVVAVEDCANVIEVPRSAGGAQLGGCSDALGNHRSTLLP